MSQMPRVSPAALWKTVWEQNPEQEHLLSFASFLVFLINAENLAKTSFPAELDSGCWVPSLGYLEELEGHRQRLVRRMQWRKTSFSGQMLK